MKQINLDINIGTCMQFKFELKELRQLKYDYCDISEGIMLSKIRIKSDNMSNLTKLNESLYYCHIITKSTHFENVFESALSFGSS